MKYLLLFILSLFQFVVMFAQTEKIDVYLIPGQGSDYRLFDSLYLGDNFNLINVHHCIPDKGMTMSEYAKELFYQIDTNRKYILIGVSLGGMLCVEMNEFHTPEKTIIVSSAKCRNELPKRYLFQEYVPIYKIVSGDLSKKGALFLQPIVEPDRNNQRDTFISMLHDKDPAFLKRTIAMILEWKPDNIIHIHGDKDKTIPVRNVKYDYLIEGGSHMMVLTRGSEISKLILNILNER